MSSLREVRFCNVVPVNITFFLGGVANLNAPYHKETECKTYRLYNSFHSSTTNNVAIIYQKVH